MKGEYNNIMENPNENNPNHHIPFPQYALHDPMPISSKKPDSTDDVATVEVTRRPRGRPPGSKNKPKQPIVVKHEPQPAMAPYILEVKSGSDVIGSLRGFTRIRGVSICVLSASGTVGNVSLKQPSRGGNNGGGAVTFRGSFDILSLSGGLLVGRGGGGDEGLGFSVMLGGPQGQVFGGKVVEPLMAVTTVYVIATCFNGCNYYRFPGGEDGEDVSAGGGSGGCYGGHVGPTGGGGGGGDVMWGPTSKAPLSSPPIDHPYH